MIRLPGTDKPTHAGYSSLHQRIYLDTKNSAATHWVVYKKIGNNGNYYNSFENLTRPLELEVYFNGCAVEYNC